MKRPATSARIVLLAQCGQSYVSLGTIDCATTDECEATWRAMPPAAADAMPSERFFAWKCLGEQATGLPCPQDVKRIATVELLRHLNCLSVEDVQMRCRLATTTDMALNKAMSLIASAA